MTQATVTQEATSPTILIVDDTPTNLEVLSKALMAAGYLVAVALDGESAISQIQYKPPALVLLDVMMPGIDGFETCRRLKADPATQAIPIIFMTALTETSNKAQGFKLGAVDYITKPFDAEEVLVRVANHLKLHQLTTHLEQEVTIRTAELTTALTKLKRAQTQLVHSERMSLIGELSAGLAYEISNPVNYIKGNLRHVDTYLNQLIAFAEAHNSAGQQPPTDANNLIEQSGEAPAPDIDLDFIREDSPKLLGSFRRGVDRIQQLVSDLCTFTGANKVNRRKMPLPDLLESCLSLIGHKLQETVNEPAIQIHKDYQHTARVECYPAPLSQALIGILLTYVNKLEAMRSKDPSFAPQITIKTYCKSEGWGAIALVTNLEQVFGSALGSALPNSTPNNTMASPQAHHPSEHFNLLLAEDIVINQHGGQLHQQSNAAETQIIFELKEILEVEAIANDHPHEALVTGSPYAASRP